MINREPDIEAQFSVLHTNEGGRKSAVHSGYRADHLIKPDYLTCAHHEFIDQEKIHPGQSGKTKVWFINPDAYPHTLWIGRVINVQEGPRVIGHLKVTEIFNKLLETKSEPVN